MDSMQALSLKITLIFWLLLPLSVRAASNPVQRGDSLFRAGAVVDAAAFYEAAIAEGQPASDAMLLKLAYSFEQQNDVPRLLYYLQVYFERHPNEAVLRKMNDIARANSLVGYETDDFNYFYLFYKEYSIYALLLGLGLGGYVVGVLLLKQLRQQLTPRRYKWITLFYLFALLLFVNLPEGYQSGITSHDQVYLRSQPSGAAPVTEVIGRGHKVNVIGSEDIWLRVFWNNQFYYIRRDNVWLI